jgi:hypothetical protein
MLIGMRSIGILTKQHSNNLLTSACYGQKSAVTFCAFPLRGRKSRQLFFAADAGVMSR